MIKICLDPGHGGKDPGSISQHGVREADINLSIAKQVRDILLPYMDVLMIRETDTTVTLEQRPVIANNAKVNAYISIHCNSAANSSAKGIETYSYPNAPNGKLLATAIHNHAVLAWGLTNRGLKTADFCVLRETNMAAALIEMAFISNPDEEAILINTEKQRLMAKAIAQGIMDYFGLKFSEEPESAYPDTKDHWADATLKELKEKGITFGYPDGTFRPDQPATRAEMITAIYKMIKLLK